MNYLKRNTETIFASIAFILIISFHLSYGMDERIFLGLIGTVATLYFGTVKYKIENDKLFKELFQEFNSRYDLRFNDLINKIKYDNGRELNADERNLIIDYLNLCSEEYLWRIKNRIPKKVWNAWKAGIKENLKIKQVVEIFQEEISSTDGRKSFYGLAEELNL